MVPGCVRIVISDQNDIDHRIVVLFQKHLYVSISNIYIIYLSIHLYFYLLIYLFISLSISMSVQISVNI